MGTIAVVTPAAVIPVSVEEAKAHSYITTTDETALISRLLGTAQHEVEDYTGLRYIEQTLDESFEAWPSDAWLTLTAWPVQSVTSISYVDEDGETQTFASSNYTVDTARTPARIWLTRNAWWPSATLRPGNSITVRYVAGYADAATVPDYLKSAILLIFGELYENRERTVLAQGVTKTTIDAVNNMLRNARRFAV